MGLRALALRSRVARRSIAPNGRTISTGSPSITNSSGGGLLSGITGMFSRLVGFVGRALSGLGEVLLSGIGAAMRALVTALEFIGNFDFQASDDELKMDIRARNERIYGIMGGLAGRGVGSTIAITIGVGVSLVVPVVGGRALAASILQSSGLEALEDYWGEVRAGVQSFTEIQAANTAAKIYMWGRRAIKALPRTTLETWLGERGADFVQQSWGAKGAEPWTITGYRDKRIEKIKHRGWRNFVEEFVDEGWDAFGEGMFLVSSDLDDAINAQLVARQEQEPVGVELTPDREAPRESVRIYGTPSEVTQRVHDVMATRQMLGNRDVGYVGALQDEGLWVPEHQRRRLTLVAYSVPSPPWTHSTEGLRSARAVKRQINVPNPKRSITWSQVKEAMGGSGGYEAGAYYATGRLSSRRKIVVYGGSESEAKQILEHVADLSEDSLQNIVVGVRERLGGRNITPANQRVRVYPAFALTAKLTQTTEEEGRLVTEGFSYAESRDRIELWRDSPPPDVSFFS